MSSTRVFWVATKSVQEPGEDLVKRDRILVRQCPTNSTMRGWGVTDLYLRAGFSKCPNPLAVGAPRLQFSIKPGTGERGYPLTLSWLASRKHRPPCASNPRRYRISSYHGVGPTLLPCSAFLLAVCVCATLCPLFFFVGDTRQDTACFFFERNPLEWCPYIAPLATLCVGPGE